MSEKRFTVRVSDSTAEQLKELARLCTEADRNRNGATSHGALTVPSLLAMLAQDASMILTRPGSWEGSNMAQVFSSHGYEV